MKSKLPLSNLGRMILICPLILGLALSGCEFGAKPPPTPTLTPAPPSQPDAQEESPAKPSATPTEAAPEPVEEPGPPPLPAVPQRVEFQAEDGKNLVGYYFPGATNPAPTVILMHWAGGDQRDWLAVAPWMQNRQDELADTPDWAAVIGADCPEQMMGPWLDPAWFPIMPEGLSFAVFIFDFRDFCESEMGLTDPSELTLDAKAAFEAVAGLEGVDPTQIAALGASIGADGAADGCLLWIEGGQICLGALSLSPGNYLMGRHFEPSYAEVVETLDGSEPPIPVWCLAAEGDKDSADTCRSASGDEYRVIIYDGDGHGMLLVVPGMDPDTMQVILEFLGEAFGVEIK
jgi:hypothetical protein